MFYQFRIKLFCLTTFDGNIWQHLHSSFLILIFDMITKFEHEWYEVIAKNKSYLVSIFVYFFYFIFGRSWRGFIYKFPAIICDVVHVPLKIDKYINEEIRFTYHDERHTKLINFSSNFIRDDTVLHIYRDQNITQS